MGERETPQAEAVARLIEEWARGMCDALDLDPDESIGGQTNFGSDVLAWKFFANNFTDAHAKADALAALAQPGMVGREEIARIIDPEAWANYDYWTAPTGLYGSFPPGRSKDRQRSADRQVAPSLAKADAILILISGEARGKPD